MQFKIKSAPIDSYPLTFIICVCLFAHVWKWYIQSISAMALGFSRTILKKYSLSLSPHVFSLSCSNFYILFAH